MHVLICIIFLMHLNTTTKKKDAMYENKKTAVTRLHSIKFRHYINRARCGYK